MREIKFRTWDKRVKCFYYFSLKELRAEGCEAQLSELNDPKHLALNTDYPYEEEEQYIDRKDKNGNEIYEGDIVRYKNEDAEYRESSGIGLIQSDNHSHCVSGFSCRDIKTKYYVRLLCGHSLFSVQIIGNVHENPELLEGTG